MQAIETADRIRQAIIAAQRGDLATARRFGEAAVDGAPAHLDALKLTGIICCQAGDLAAGTGFLKRALAVAPRDRDVRLNLAKATMSLGDWPAAEALCRDAAPTMEDEPELVRMLAYILQVDQRQAEAIPLFEAVLASEPEDFETWNNLGNARRQTGDLEGAIAALQRAFALRQDIAIIPFNLGGALAEARRLEEAADAFRAAVTLEPDNPAILIEFGRLLSALGRYGNALAVLSSAVEFVPDDVSLLVDTGDLHAQLNDRAAAESLYREAIAADPSYVPAWLSLGLLLEGANRDDDLRALTQKAVASGVPDVDIGLLHALILKRDGDFAKALPLAVAATAPVAVGRKYHLIGELADRTGDHDQAFAAFTEMNRLIAGHPVDPRLAAAAYRQEFAAATARLTPEWVASWQPADVAVEPGSPTFIVGFPRSGTTLLDTILMGHPQLHVLEEVPIMQRIADALGNPDDLATIDGHRIAALRTLYFSELAARAPAEPGLQIVDKLPFNIIHLALINRLFPDARIVFALRHPADVVLSCFIQNFRINNATANFLDLQDTATLYDIALGHWQKAREVLPLAVHDFRYEAVVDDTEGALRALIAFLDLPWTDRLLDHQQTAAERSYIGSPSYAQVIQPIYNRASGRWRRYERHLASVMPTLQPWIERLGY